MIVWEKHRNKCLETKMPFQNESMQTDRNFWLSLTIWNTFRWKVFFYLFSFSVFQMKQPHGQTRLEKGVKVIRIEV